MLARNYLNMGILLIIIISLISAGWAANGLAASPTSINVQTQSSNIFETEITVTNVGDTVLNVNVTKKRMMKDSTQTLYADDGIATWITADPVEFTLAPNEKKTVKITVNIPSDINYTDAMGALIIQGITIDSSQNESSSGTNLKLKQVPAILIPVIVGLPGQIIESISLSSQNIPWVLLSLMPGNLEYNVTNNGTVQAQMINNVTVKGLFENQNFTSNGTVYPGDDYTFKTQWTPGLFDMGFYDVESNINYGREQKTQNLITKNTIFVFPSWLIIVILLILVGWQIRKKDIHSPIQIKIEKKK